MPAKPQQTQTRPAEALAALGRLLGNDNVITAREALSRYETATFATTQSIRAVVLPKSAEETQKVVEIANRYEVPLYPISRGRNWGLGSRVPIGDGNIVVDLQRMNRIVDFSEERAYITVEPGVTFQQVADYLKQRQSQLYLTAIGGPPDSSVLANALERGDGVGPLGDRARYCGALQAILPTGEIIDTGLAAFDDCHTAHTAHFGLGPGIEGLFFQSNLGIVTRMTVWLAKRPPNYQCLVFAVDSEASLTAANREIRQLQQLGLLTDTAYSLWNVYRFLTAQMQYPWGADGTPAASPEELLERLPAAWRGVKWVGFLGLYAPSLLHGVAQRQLAKRALSPHTSKLMVVDSVTAHLGRFLGKPLQRITGVDVAKMINTLYFESVFVGHPTKLEISSIYWRKRGKLPAVADPDGHGCGLHWICVSLPYEGEHIARTTRIVEEVALGYGLEPLCMFFNMTQWYLKSFIVIMFDRDIPAEEEAAQRCHDDLLEKLKAAGYPPVRLGVQSMAQAAPDQQSYIDLIQRLKKALDPKDIIAPGRYDFRHRWR